MGAKMASPVPGVHAPEDRPLEVEEHPPGQLEPQTGREAGLAVVAALVGEGEVMHAPHDRGLQGLGARRASRALPIVEVVDGVPPRPDRSPSTTMP